MDPDITGHFRDTPVWKQPPNELDDGSVYAGHWTKDGLRHGKGSCVWKNGQFYEGLWVNDKMDSTGRMVYEDNNVYYGEFKAGKCHGYGCFVNSRGASYNGYWDDE